MPRKPVYQPLHEAPGKPILRQKRSFILVNLALLAGLGEGFLWRVLVDWRSTPYPKAVLLMLGTVGLFALAVRIAEPISQRTSSIAAAIQRSSGPAVYLGLQALILFLLFVGYVNVFFN